MVLQFQHCTPTVIDGETEASVSAWRSWEAGDVAGAAAAFAALLAADTAASDARLGLAYCAAHAGDVAAAQDYLDAAITQMARYHPRLHFQGAFLWGVAAEWALMEGDVAAAEHAASAAIFQDHDHARAYGLRALARAVRGDITAAQEDVEHYTKRKPNAPTPQLDAIAACAAAGEISALKITLCEQSAALASYTAPRYWHYKHTEDATLAARFDTAARTQHRAALAEMIAEHSARHDQYHRDAAQMHCVRALLYAACEERAMAANDMRKAVDYDRHCTLAKQWLSQHAE